jgi:hypothetical protein
MRVRRLGFLLLMLLAVPAWAVTVTPEVILVDPLADIQAAIDNTPDGGTLRLGPGTFVAPDSAGWFIERSITIIGAGIGRADSAGTGTCLRPYLGDTDSPDPDAQAFTITSSGVYFRDLCIGNLSAPAAASDSLSGNGVFIDATSDTIRDVVLERVTITHMGGFGVALYRGSHSVVGLHLYLVDLTGNSTGATWQNDNIDPRRWPCDFNGALWYAPTTDEVHP